MPMREKITLHVNGQQHVVEVDPETPLLFVLNDELGLRGPRFGCGMAQCGACTVIMDGQVVRSCVKPVSAVGPGEVTTLEGLGTPEKPHPIQQAFIEEGAAQCGFCLSGVILTAKAVLDVKPPIKIFAMPWVAFCAAASRTFACCGQFESTPRQNEHD
jgi:nicotinate dehydrogenase subunit A